MSMACGILRLKALVVFTACSVLACTFYWDFVTLQGLSNPRHTSHSLRHSKNTSLSWSWECAREDDKSRVCRRVLNGKPTSLTTCTMTCTPELHLWPLPTGEIRIKSTIASFLPHQVKVDFSPVNSPDLSKLMKKTTILYQERISDMAKMSHNHTSSLKVAVNVQLKKTSKDVKFKLNIDESYKLTVSQKGNNLQAIVKSNTFLGAHHGLETLLQLIWWDEKCKLLKITNNVVISDTPIFTYRGLMLDTARNFIPVPLILNTIHAMSLNKMNVFHWHMTDSKSFPFASFEFPKFTQTGAYSSKAIYSMHSIRQVIEFAEVRAVTVLVEIDAPAHTSQGWDWGEGDGIGNLSLCLNDQPYLDVCVEPPCGQLNPVNNYSYSVLVDLIKEINTEVEQQNIMHIGGDDVDLRCWETFGDVTDTEVYMKKGVMGVWEMFYKTFLNHLALEKIAPRNFIMWSNELLDGSEIWHQLKNTSIIVQCRGLSNTGELERLVKQRYEVIVSSGAWSTLSDAHYWEAVYNHRPWAELSGADSRLVVGGEAIAWTDRLDRHSLESSLWPNAAAVAERLWTDPAQSATPLDRFVRQRLRMVLNGIQSSPVVPEWCYLNPFQCS